jgi:mono/diheme cytochrome c family protein
MRRLQIIAAQAGLLGSLAAIPAQAAGAYMTSQANVGRDAYAEHCASCHQPDLSGIAAPQLKGDVFRHRWRPHSTAQLLDFVKSMMPLGDVGSLSDEEYRAVVAFLLESNGAPPGGAPLTAETDVPLKSVWQKSPPAHERRRQ